MAGVVVLDASTLIALHDESDSHHPWALDLLRSTLSDEWVMSGLTYAETLVHPLRAGRVDEFERSVVGLGIVVADLMASDARSVAALRASTQLRMPDAIVLQLAISTQGVLATADLRLARGAVVLGLSVACPTLD